MPEKQNEIQTGIAKKLNESISGKEKPQNAVEFGTELYKKFKDETYEPQTVLNTIFSTFDKNKSKFKPSLTAVEFINAYGEDFTRLVQIKLAQLKKYKLNPKDISGKIDAKTSEAIYAYKKDTQNSAEQEKQEETLLPEKENTAEEKLPEAVTYTTFKSSSGGLVAPKPKEKLVPKIQAIEFGSFQSTGPKVQVPKKTTLDQPVISQTPTTTQEEQQPPKTEIPEENLPTQTVPQPIETKEKPSESEETFAFAERPKDAMSGSEFFKKVLGVSPEEAKDDKTKLGLIGPEREALILAEIEKGNIPDYLRKPQEVKLGNDQDTSVTVQVMPDYIAIGSNEDHQRIPMTPRIAGYLAQKYNLGLPTQTLVQAIYNQAKKEGGTVFASGLVQDISDSAFMQGNAFTLRHNQNIDKLKKEKKISQDQLFAGPVKDIIYSSYAEKNDTIDLMGHFGLDGKPIHPAGPNKHKDKGGTYEDYDSAVRFVGSKVKVVKNGKVETITYEDALKNKELAKILNGIDGTLNTEKIYQYKVPQLKHKNLSTKSDLTS